MVGSSKQYYNIVKLRENNNGENTMTVRERILEAKLIEKVNKNPALAKQMGIEIEQWEGTKKLNNSEIRSSDNLK